MGFSQALSGVNAAAKQLDVVGNNIANSQTAGFKSSSVQFADVFAAQAGLGTRVVGELQDFSNGALEATGRNLDLAIAGDGFLRFSQNGEVGFSRNGQLTMTAEGDLVNAQGAKLMGYNVANFNDPVLTATVPSGGLPEAINIPAEGMVAKATSEASVSYDLDAADEAPIADFDAGDPATYNYSTSMSVFDSQGTSYNLRQYFVKEEGDSNSWRVESRVSLAENHTFSKSTDENGTYTTNLPANVPTNEPVLTGAWPAPADTTSVNGTYQTTDGKYSITVAGASSILDANDPPNIIGVTGGTITYQAILEDSNLSFDNNGQLSAVSYNKNDNTLVDPKPAGVGVNEVQFSFDGNNGSAPMLFTFDYSGTTQTAQDYAINDPRQNGYESGKLVGISFTDDGLIQGNYSNEQTVGLGRVVLSNFRNPEGLEPMGDNMWAETNASGAEVVGTAGTGQFGSIESGTLEASNVDLTSELVDLIIAQRNYQANTNSIRTQSEVMDAIAQLR